ncbi:MAG: hypothetical protein HZA54_11105 [Planctomycetes bacterium]|nr:hypothetical protein [Planctomycetota bacterium]
MGGTALRARCAGALARLGGPAGWWACLGLILALGAAWRLVALENQGLALSDEAAYLNEAHFMAAAVRALPLTVEFGLAVRRPGAEAAERAETLRAELRRRVPTFFLPFMAKPAHAFLIALLLLAGVPPELAGSLEACAFGLLTILGAAWVARRWYGPGPGLLTALVLALSPLSVLYHRSPLAEADATFFVGLAAALALTAGRAAAGTPVAAPGGGGSGGGEGGGGAREIRYSPDGPPRFGPPWPLRLAFLAGLAGGLAFLCNCRLVPVPVYLPLVLWFGDGRAAPGRGRALLWLIAGMALPVLAAEAVYPLALGWLDLPRSSVAYTYFDRLLHALLGQGVREAGFGEWAPLTVLVERWEGAVFPLLALLGVARAAAARTPADRVLLVGLGLGLLLFMSRATQQALRYLYVLLPPAAVLAGGLFRAGGASGVDGANGANRARWSARLASPLVVAAAALAVVLAAHPEPAVRAVSGWAAALRFVRTLGGGNAAPAYFIAETEIGWAHELPATRAKALPETGAELARQVRGGTRYLVVGPDLIGGFGIPGPVLVALKEMGGAVHPWSFPHPVGAQARYANELCRWGGEPFAASEKRAEHLARLGGTIRVYDLGAWFK